MSSATRTCLAAALVLVALPASIAAQELTFSPDATEACLAGSPSNLACVGASADVCIAGPGGGSNAGMSACWGREARYWQGRVDVALGRHRAQATENDRVLDEVGSAASRALPALDAMIAAFDAHRAALCGYEATTWGGGSGAGPAASQCVMTVTALQALILERGIGLR